MLALLAALLPAACRAHGRLTKPAASLWAAKTGPEGSDGYYSCWRCSTMDSGYCCETDPVFTTDGSSPRTNDDFVCRHDKPPNSGIRRAEVSAGQNFDLEWDMMADHVGDCSVYLTYDVDAPRRQQRYVKIANLPDCRSQNKRRVSIDIPVGLPAGPAILRWDWMAIHLWPKVEWYAQCVDIQVRSSSGADPSALNGFSIVDPPIYPVNGNEGVGFRDPYSGDGYSNQGKGYMTGPACFDEALNACDLTKAGTQGYTGVGGAGGAPAPMPPPGASPARAPAQPSPGGCEKEKYAQCGGQGFSGDACCPAGMWCKPSNQWWSQCEPCGETWDAACEGGEPASPSPPPPAPAPSPGPAPPAPGPSPSSPARQASQGCAKEKYAQCGGQGFSGDACCPSGMWCMRTSRWWSQCEPCGETWNAACDGGEPASPSPPPPALAPAPGQASQGCEKEKYAQCGGQGFSGDACCPAGMWCMPSNQWWSQCEPCGETWNAACDGGGSPALAEVRLHRFLKPGRHATGGIAWVQRGATAGKHVRAAAAEAAQE